MQKLNKVCFLVLFLMIFCVEGRGASDLDKEASGLDEKGRGLLFKVTYSGALNGNEEFQNKLKEVENHRTTFKFKYGSPGSISPYWNLTERKYIGVTPNSEMEKAYNGLLDFERETLECWLKRAGIVTPIGLSVGVFTIGVLLKFAIDVTDDK